MSQQINCPFCGFANFAISAYCGRCERPLPPPEAEAPKSVAAPNPAIRGVPPRAPNTQPPPPSAAAERPTTPPIERIRAHQAPRPVMMSQEPTQAMPPPKRPEGAAPVVPPRPRPEGTATQVQLRPRPEGTATQVQLRPRPEGTATQVQARPMPVPVPHDDATVVRAVNVPAEARAPDKFEAMYEEAVANQPRAPRLRDEEPVRRRPLDEGPLELGDLDVSSFATPAAPPADRAAPVRMDTDPTTIPASRPAYWRLVGAFGIDAALVAALGATVVGSEMALFAGRWPAENGALAALGEWLSLYPGTAMRALATMGCAGVLYSAWGGRRGATLGRHAACLLALHQSGERLGWGRALARSMLSVLSILAFGGGYFWTLVDRRKRAWHDILAGSVVVHHQVR